MHRAYGEAVRVVPLEEGPRPLGAHVGPRVADECVVSYGQAGVGVVVASDDVVGLGEVVPHYLLVATGDLADPVVHGRVPLHLLPDAL